MSLKCDPLDCQRQGSDNTTGDIAFIAPMKIKFLKRLIFDNKQRRVVALMLLVCLALCALTPGKAQVRNQRRVTALQLGQAAEGSRVTVVSDSALNDYEAFRRGDRFYVKIPLADFTAASPHFRADGFEDVQVQKVGDSLIVSFKLQPGATARVDQRGNRLDVIFSAPNRNSYNAANARAGRAPSESAGLVENSQTSQSRGRDAAGPMPPGSVVASRDRVVTDRAVGGSESRAPRNPWDLTNTQSDPNKSSKRAANDKSQNANAAVTSPSPVSSPTSLLTSGTSSIYSPTATPAVSPTSRAVAGSPGSGGFLNWKQRGNAVLKWVSDNRLATLVGALILLGLIGYLAMSLRSRQKNVVKAKRAKAPKVQPKYSPDGELNELSNPSLPEQTASPVKNEPTTAQAGSDILVDRAARAGDFLEQSESRERELAAAPSTAAAKLPSQWVLTNPSITSPTAGSEEHSSEEEEREVFEL